MEYRYSALATETVKWATAKGNVIEVTAILKESLEAFATGCDFRRTDLRVSTRAALNGKDLGEGWIQAVSGQGDSVASICRLLLTQDKVDLVNSAIAAVKQHPEWVADQAARATGRSAHDAHQADAARLDKIQ